MWNDSSGCNSLVLSNPQVDSIAHQLRIISEGKAKIGTAIGNRCLPLLDWRGIVEVFQKPMLDPQSATVHFRIVKSNIYNPKGRKDLTTGKLWDAVKEYVHPKFSQVRVDLQSLLVELQSLLPLVLSQQDRDRIQAAANSLAFTKTQATDAGIKITLHFELPDFRSPQASTSPEPILSSEELQRWEKIWRYWDAFLTFVIKHAAAESRLEELRLALLEILLDTRYDIEEALTSPIPGAHDPVRALFRRTWERLSPVLRRLSLSMPHEAAMRYLSFIAASDALKIIDQLGPIAGLDISTDGLRRLARTLAPQESQDPLLYSFEVDPSLRRSFGFGPPLLSLLQERPDLSFSHWFWRNAWAADGVDQALIARLNRWAPTASDIDVYLPLVHRLLDRTTNHLLRTRPLKPPFQSLYRWLLLATAWQESCWRQFIKQGDAIKPLRSNAGSVGLMQINQNVWRGFYDVNKLSQNIAYNAKAGGEILMHYLVDYAIRKGEGKKTDNIHNLARATYAAYNGGPRHLSRYRKKNISKSLRKIDGLFWDKYQIIKQGKELAVAQCFGAEVSSFTTAAGDETVENLTPRSNGLSNTKVQEHPANSLK
jgi:hypothetical protein